MLFAIFVNGLINTERVYIYLIEKIKVIFYTFYDPHKILVVNIFQFNLGSFCFTPDIRDRPFNLKGGYGFLFRSEFFFGTTRELEYLFYLSRKARNFFHNLTLEYMTKTLNHIIFFFLHQNQNIFFSNVGNQNIFLEKNITRGC